MDTARMKAKRKKGEGKEVTVQARQPMLGHI